MRIKAGIVVSGLAALAAASSSAAIYELGSPAFTDASLQVSPDQARLGLAKALGVSRYYKLSAQGTSETQIAILEKLVQLEGRIGSASEDEGRLVLSLSGVGAEDADSMSACLLATDPR